MAGRITVTDVMKAAYQLNLRWAIILDYPSGPHGIIRILVREERAYQKDVAGERPSPAIAGFAGGSRSRVKESRQRVEAGKGKDGDSLPEPPEGIQPC